MIVNHDRLELRENDGKMKIVYLRSRVALKPSGEDVIEKVIENIVLYYS